MTKPRPRARSRAHDTGSYIPGSGTCRAANKARHTRKGARLLARRTGTEAYPCEFCDDYHVGRRRAEKWAPGGVEHQVVSAIIARGGWVVRTHLDDVAAAVCGDQRHGLRLAGRLLQWLAVRDLARQRGPFVTADPEALREFLAAITAPAQR